jgi:hypothetical protein
VGQRPPVKKVRCASVQVMSPGLPVDYKEKHKRFRFSVNASAVPFQISQAADQEKAPAGRANFRASRRIKYDPANAQGSLPPLQD